MSIKRTDENFEERVWLHLPALVERMTGVKCPNGMSMGSDGIRRWTKEFTLPYKYAVDAFDDGDANVAVGFMFTLKDLEAVEAECEQCKRLQHNPHHNEEAVI